jgi:hypothetical protein
LSSSCRPSLGADPARAGYLPLVLAVVLALAGCGVGPQAHPVPVEGNLVTSTRSGNDDTSGPVVVKVFLVRGSHLVGVSRVVSHRPGLDAGLVALSRPTSDRESAAGLRNDVPSGPEPLSGTLVGSVARVEMPPGFDRRPVRDQIAALAQIVYTVLVNSSAVAVEVFHGDRAIPVPGADGALLDRPVRRGDYASWAPLPAGDAVQG